MRPCTDEVEVRNILTPIVRPEPRGLREHGFDGERAAEVTVQRLVEVARINTMFGHNVPTQPGKVALLEVADDGVAVRPGCLCPVGSPAEMRDRGQHVPAVTASGRERRVGRSRAMEVE